MDSSPSLRRLRCWACSAAACALVAFAGGGCVPAESARYRGTMKQTLEPQRTANADVASAFGLQDAGSAINLAAAADE